MMLLPTSREVRQPLALDVHDQVEERATRLAETNPAKPAQCRASWAILCAALILCTATAGAAVFLAPGSATHEATSVTDEATPPGVADSDAPDPISLPDGGPHRAIADTSAVRGLMTGMRVVGLFAVVALVLGVATSSHKAQSKMTCFTSRRDPCHKPGRGERSPLLSNPTPARCTNGHKCKVPNCQKLHLCYGLKCGHGKNPYPRAGHNPVNGQDGSWLPPCLSTGPRVAKRKAMANAATRAWQAVRTP